MKDSVLFGNGINRVSNDSNSWRDLLDRLMGNHQFDIEDLPNTMVYEQIFMNKYKQPHISKSDELSIKVKIAETLAEQNTNQLFDSLASLNVEHYLTTNYDYTFQKSLSVKPELLSTEEIYSLRRKRRYELLDGKNKYLWNIHGEIDLPKTIMLGLDHYCGSLSKLDAYVKGRYKHIVDGKTVEVTPMIDKLKRKEFCNTSWIDLFFNTNVHILGLSLDYSETDIWWVLNKRARLQLNNKSVENEIYFYCDGITEEKRKLLNSFGVVVVEEPVLNDGYESMYQKQIQKIKNNLDS